MASGRCCSRRARGPGEQRGHADRERWPRWAQEALRRGLRCSIDLVPQLPSITLVLALFGVRPGA